VVSILENILGQCTVSGEQKVTPSVGISEHEWHLDQQYRQRNKGYTESFLILNSGIVRMKRALHSSETQMSGTYNYQYRRKRLPAADTYVVHPKITNY
jgi:hypothetical protein